MSIRRRWGRIDTERRTTGIINAIRRGDRITCGCKEYSKEGDDHNGETKGSEMREWAMQCFEALRKKIGRAIGKGERGKKDQKKVRGTFSVVDPAGGVGDGQRQ